MELNAPRKITWWIALILGVLGLIGWAVPLGIISTLAFWLVLVGWLLLLLGAALKGL
jgi:hypothetical protein